MPLAALVAAQAGGASDSGLLAPTTDGALIRLPELDPEIPSPADVLGYPLGGRFTQHAAMVSYLERLGETAPRVHLERYGATYQERPLLLLALSSPANLERLADIQADLARLADPAGLSATERQALIARSPVVVWLGYGIHGNESSSAEAALAAVYILAAARGPLAELLDHTIVLIDPLLNPDGRERYVHGYLGRRGRIPDPHPAAAELHEPWPGGRGNHYYVDLNRDWAWATQRETRHRLRAYQKWNPHVFVDFHEMSPRSTYFFPPPAEPVLSHIDPHIVRWLRIFGEANAAAFDRQSWLYYAEEIFDLFYPGYGDSYPALRGAVGMTYEMAGGGGAGSLVRRPDGTELSLADRVARHLSTTMATVETAARFRRELLTDFVTARVDRSSGPGRTYLWSGDSASGLELAQLLARHGIAVFELTAPETTSARPLAGGDSRRQRFPAGTLGASTAQPLGNLLQALMDLESPLDPGYLAGERARAERNLQPRFYDVTSWSLPLAYGVEAWIVGQDIRSRRAWRAEASGPGVTVGPLGLLVPPQGLAGYRLAAGLQRHGLRYRVALEAHQRAGRRFPPGTLWIPRQGNPEDLESRLAELLVASGARGAPVSTLAAEEGIWLGSDRVVSIRAARVGLVGGEGVIAASFGALWHLLDRQLELAMTRLELSALSTADLAEFDVLILPDGTGYARALGEEGTQRLEAWVRAGGTLVAVGSSHSFLERHGLSTVASWSPDEAGEAVEARADAEDDPPVPDPLFGVPGASVRTELETTHPLAVGLPQPPAVLFQGHRYLISTGNPQRDLLVVRRDDPVLAGVVWSEARKRLAGSLLVSAEPLGRGKVVVFAQHPAFRLFWRAATPLFLNAVLFGPSLELPVASDPAIGYALSSSALRGAVDPFCEAIGRTQQVKQEIHPELRVVTAVCACGNTFQTRTTRQQLRLEICNVCHPFFTGKQKLVDSAGRVERFRRRYAKPS